MRRDAAITVERLSKRYRLGESSASGFRYRTLRESLAGLATTLSGRRGRARPRGDAYFWALRDVDLEIKRGEAVGIIGRNGAGKSTLLKILSRITAPTSGQARVRGRVASLLEVGTGFHPELTGRENIYLSAAIFGMHRAEVRRSFDEIVAFAEVEQFVGTPVKRYSSGMYTRLAFAVAAFLNADILLVDEVLAVGDAAFQRKCLGKMNDVTGDGRTVLFVSHNLAAIRALAPRCVLLASGSVAEDGPTGDVIARYLQLHAAAPSPTGHYDLRVAGRALHKHDLATSKAYFRRGLVLDDRGAPTGAVTEGKRFSIAVEIEVREPISHVELAASFHTVEELRLFTVHSDVFPEFVPGVYRARIDVAPNYLRPGAYHLSLGLFGAGRPDGHDGLRHAVDFFVQPSTNPPPTLRAAQSDLGVIQLPYRWTSVENVPAAAPAYPLPGPFLDRPAHPLGKLSIPDLAASGLPAMSSRIEATGARSEGDRLRVRDEK